MAFYTMSHDFIFYLVGPFSFFYVRGMLRDNTDLSKKDWLHFLPFLISFTGSIPYYFSSWDYKLLIADNILSENWDTAQFELNMFLPHKLDQVLNALVMYFYAGSLWYLIWKYKRDANSRIYNVPQFKLIRNWLIIFTLIVTIITINFTLTVAYILIYDDKSVFLQKASGPLLFASVFYVIINMVVMFFPHIMYGLPLESLTVSNKAENKTIPLEGEIAVEKSPEIEHILTSVLEDEKSVSLQLFSDDYMLIIKEQLKVCIEKEMYLNTEFKIINIVSLSGIAPHHLSYYFNSVLNSSFSEWRNNLRIEYILKLIDKWDSKNQTLESLSLQSGFINQNTFIRAFKSRTGVTPSQYVKGLK
jgi:AraC-like DNA-binding protein